MFIGISRIILPGGQDVELDMQSAANSLVDLFSKTRACVRRFPAEAFDGKTGYMPAHTRPYRQGSDGCYGKDLAPVVLGVGGRFVAGPMDPQQLPVSRRPSCVHRVCKFEAQTRKLNTRRSSRLVI